MMIVEFRPATAADSDWCYRLHRAAFHDYVKAIWGWDEPTQRSFHDRGFRPDTTRIITAARTQVGAVSVERTEGVTYLGRITIHPDHQGHGIGTQVLGHVIEQATAHGEPVLLDVLIVNHRAHALYRRLGFCEQYRHGENNIKIRMRRDPS
jgi:ribosomal protein S18 acetylase RimI-like enzyme